MASRVRIFLHSYVHKLFVFGTVAMTLLLMYARRVPELNLKCEWHIGVHL